MRARPENGGIVWHARANALECEGCGELIAQGRRVWMDPERLVIVRELVMLDHTECWEFDDPRMAKLARRFRKGLKRGKAVVEGKGENVTGLGGWERARAWLRSWVGTRRKWKAAEKQILALRELNSALVKKGLRREARIGRLESELDVLVRAAYGATPGLTPAEVERLAILAEECGEAVRAVGKALRFGWESKSPYSERTNREALEREIGSIRAAVNLMMDADDVRLSDVQGWQRVKRGGLDKWTLHQAESIPREDQLAMLAAIASEQR
jgi:hypothetical protein